MVALWSTVAAGTSQTGLEAGMKLDMEACAASLLDKQRLGSLNLSRTDCREWAAKRMRLGSFVVDIANAVVAVVA